MQKQISFKLVSLIFGVLVICFLAGFYILAWTGPTATPPGDNVPTPLNVGPDAQTKQGPLIVNTDGIEENGLVVDKGKLCIGADCKSSWSEVGGAVTKIHSAVGTTTESQGGTGTWVDMPDMLINENFKAGDILIQFTAPIYSHAGTNMFRILLDGSEIIKTSFCISGLNAGWARIIPVSMHTRATVAEGNHTIKVQWWSNTNSCQSNAPNYGERVLTVIAPNG